jgi:hypothetical protein
MDFIQIGIGAIIIAHGLVHIMFEFYIQDTENNKNVGWSGESWLLSKFLDDELLKLVGRILWGLVILGFVVAGLGYFDLPILIDWWNLVIIFSSVLSLVSFMLFWNGLGPSPLYYIVGIVLDVVFLILPFIQP